ncbi:2-dehydro-3-deoxygluconokinase [Salegentibacter sp. 24]|jgi:2-dehydro-3-deoxygluconokinase|uniref:sugar kinase n=1 Tax=Salegentibacter sp. 24 TaxID=2183986 RepID=UPI00105F0308|nr:sugar kinase [Salegentibacter sp. 24]TDN95437.1 2-dehydro-3-deoxygluconokinase [Salegentibacter sp. 24]
MKELGKNSEKVVTFGEVLMRLSPPGNKKLQQSTSLEFFFGGTELNVAESLSYFGLEVTHVSNVSNDLVGDAALAFIRQFGVDVSAINKVDHPLGLYFLEVGAAMRPSQIAYNRLNAAFANISPEEIDWKNILKDASYFHWTGITPGISKGAYETLKAGLTEAKKKGVIVSADPAYRSNLWKYGREGSEILAELTGLSTIFIGGVNEINEILKTNFEFNKEGFISASRKLIQTYPSIEKVFDKVRTGLSASWQKIYGQAWTGTQYLTTEELEITDVIDRIGTGDAYAAGLLYGLQHFDDQKTLEFANAACALKHTILGDANLVSVSEVLEVTRGDTGGRIKR